MKTKFDSYCINDIPKGCKLCVQGKKLVLFISGKCSRNCYYCSLSNARKNKDIIWANEKICISPKQAIQEAKYSNAKGTGITGGDPLLFLKRTLKYAKALKQAFGKSFHIHIYLPTNLVTESNLKKLSKYIDEVRFHPSFLQIQSNDKKDAEKAMQKDIEKLKLANKIFKRQNIGIEMPCFPDKKQQIIQFIKQASPFISFVNLNELEISETNFAYFTKKYKFNEDTYTIKGSKQAALEILKACSKIGLKIHFCTACLKNIYQFGNRLKLRNALPFMQRDSEGMADYFATSLKNKPMLQKLKIKQFCIDKSKNQIILSQKIIPKLLKANKFKISRIKEYPTSDRTEVEFYYIN